MKQITRDINFCQVPLLAPARRVGHASSRTAAPRRPFSRAVDQPTSAGATHVLLACTELPIALATAPHPACIDTTEALARSCLTWWRARQP